MERTVSQSPGTAAGVHVPAIKDIHITLADLFRTKIDMYETGFAAKLQVGLQKAMCLLPCGRETCKALLEAGQVAQQMPGVTPCARPTSNTQW